MKHVRRIVRTVLFLSFIGPLISIAGELDEERLRAEVTDSLPRLRNAISNIDVEYQVTTELLHKTPSKTSRRMRRYYTDFENRFAKVDMAADDTDLKGIEVWNPQYSALLEVRDSAISIASLEKLAPSDARILLEEAAWGLSVGFRFDSVFVGDLFEQSEFTLVKIETDSDRDRVKAVWTWNVERAPQSKIEIVFAPSTDWAIVSLTLRHPQGDMTREIAYQPFQGSFVPKKIVQSDFFPNSKTVAARDTILFSAPSTNTCDEKMYYLSGYGLSEPVFDNASMAFRIAVFISGLILIAGAIYLFGRKRPTHRAHK